jgi:hypothetical protein
MSATGRPASACFFWDRGCVVPPENPCWADGWAFDLYYLSRAQRM